MPHKYSELDQLKPLEVLSILAKTVSVHSDKKELSDYLLKLYILPTGQNYSLYLPDSAQKTQIQETIIAGFRDSRGEGERLVPEIPDNKLPLWIPLHGEHTKSGLLELLVKDHAASNKQQLAKKSSQDHLFLHNSPTNVAELTGQLRGHATTILAATAQQHQDELAFLYIKGPSPTFTGLKSSGYLNEWQELDGYSLFEDYQLFLPEGLTPSQPALDAFGEILYEVPELFTAQRIRHKRLAAVIPDGMPITDTTTFSLWYLAHLDFADPNEIIPFRNASFFVDHLTQTDEQMAKLYETFKGVSTGHYMSIRATRFAEDTESKVIEQERDRLERRIEKLSEELYELTEIAEVKKDYLLRFTHKQLFEFCEYLSQRSGLELRDGRLLYAYQETKQHPQGLHYLYVSKELVEPVVNPLVTRAVDGELNAIQFWQDPFWIKHYQEGHGNKSKLFVPRNTFMWPTIHCWNDNPGEIDAYLRDLVCSWFDHHKLDDFHRDGEFPGSPIYVFDSKADANEIIDVYVLDLENFRPLYTKLSWINDNLTLQKAVNNRPLIEQISNDVTWVIMAGKIIKAKSTGEKLFKQAKDDTYMTAAKYTQELTSELSAKINELINSTNRQQQEIAKLQQRLHKLAEVYRVTHKIVTVAEGEDASLRADIQTGNIYQQDIQREVESYQMRTEEIITSTHQVIDDLARKLSDTYNEEKRKLDNLRMGR